MEAGGPGPSLARAPPAARASAAAAAASREPPAPAASSKQPPPAFAAQASASTTPTHTFVPVAASTTPTPVFAPVAASTIPTPVFAPAPASAKPTPTFAPVATSTTPTPTFAPGAASPNRTPAFAPVAASSNRTPTFAPVSASTSTPVFASVAASTTPTPTFAPVAASPNRTPAFTPVAANTKQFHAFAPAAATREPFLTAAPTGSREPPPSFTTQGATSSTPTPVFAPAAASTKPLPAFVPACASREIPPARSSPPAGGPQSPPASSREPAVPPSNNPRRQRPPRPTENNKEVFDRYNARRVHVTGFPPYTQAGDLGRTFSRFGNVRVERLNTRLSYAYLAFDTEDEAKAAVQASKTLIIYGEFLQVKPYAGRPEQQKPLAPKRDFTRTKLKGVIVDPQQIPLSGDFHQQADRVLAAVRLTQEEATLMSSLYADLEQVLQPLWPGCVAMPFGSITTGLGIKTSDADCFVRVPRVYLHPSANLVNKAKRVLQAHPNVFAEILAIPRANTPIVKFFHIPTSTNCDLSFKTPLGAQNSKLIAFLLHRDPRLVPVAVLVKYWAKVHGLSGTGKLTNYALTMMIIFYLQQPPLSILPAVEYLQRDRANDVIVDFWNTGFMDRRDVLPPITNTWCLYELLGGFFEFYSQFNFEDMVVCPYLGTAIRKDLFKDLNYLPKEYDRYKSNVLNKLVLPMRVTTPMCVQDPFEQSHNVASAITNKLAMEIKLFFKFAANAYEKEKQNKCQELLQKILLDKPKIVRTKTHPEYRMNIFPKIIHNIATPDWKAVVREIILRLFVDMLKIQLGKVEDKEKRNPESKKEKEKYAGVVTRAIWKRKQFSRLYSMMNLDFQQKQTRITEEIINADKHVFDLQFQMTITFGHEPRSSAVAIRLANGDPEAFKEFGKFFISVLQNWFMILLRPYTAPSGQEAAANLAETIKLLDSNLDAANDLDSDDDDVNEAVDLANGSEEETDKDSPKELPTHETITEDGSNPTELDTH